ncbi:PIN domain-containing protein [Spirosoma flavum]|uniref:PIN domain-containing protein n=1 Tax=Spirosoma flavum TaxID=2048557 RepID=A0ABW6AH18_9BACT
MRSIIVDISVWIDCFPYLIAHYAIFYNIPMLHNDIDFDQIARFTALRVTVQ